MIDPHSEKKRSLLLACILVAAAGAFVVAVKSCEAAEGALAPVYLERALCPLLPAPQEAEFELLLPLLPERPVPGQTVHELRVARAEVIVRALYNHNGRASFLPHCEYLVTYHEWLEAEGVRKGYPRAVGYGAAYYWSLVYGGANFSLRCYATAPGNCAGPMDVKHWPLVTEPEKNVRWHCQEMWGFYKQGVRGRDLCESVYYPARPHDWGGGRFCKTDARHRKAIREAYRKGKL